MAKTKKTDDSAAPAKRRAAAPRPRAPRKAVPVPDAPPTTIASVSATQPIAVASDMSVPSTPEGIADTRVATSEDTDLVAGATTTNPPSYEEIAEAAYHRYLQRGGGHGMDYEDWVEAERALRSRR